MKTETITIELLADDLSPEGIKKFKDQGVWNDNWDIMPLVILEFDVEYEPTDKEKRREKGEALKKGDVKIIENNLAINLCPFCSDPVLANLFKSTNYLDEWIISGLCEKCQDEVFKPEN